MKTIQTRAVVTPEGTLVVRVPSDIPAGEHNVVVIIDEVTVDYALPADELELPVHDCGPWPDSLSLRREDLYDEWGR